MSDQYKGAAKCPGTERLRLKVLDLKKRIRLARPLWNKIARADGLDASELAAADALLDLRKPLRAKGKR